jgi:UDP-glucuronate decarboxylase
METPDEITGPINLGNPNEFTMLELANQIITASASKSEISFCDLPSDDPKQRKPDISKARTILGWEPKVQLQQGLEKTIHYFAAQLQNP